MTRQPREDDEACADATKALADIQGPWPYDALSDEEMDAAYEMILHLWRGVMRTGNYAEDWKTRDERHFTSTMNKLLKSFRRKRKKPVGSYFKLFSAEAMEFNEETAESKAGNPEAKGKKKKGTFGGKEPDWCFSPKRCPRGVDADHHALFIECKVLSEKSLTKYGMHGIRAFSSLAYARAMSRAMLVGYVIPTRATSDKDLAAYLEKPITRRELQLVSCQHLKTGQHPPWYLFESQHSRPSAYKEYPLAKPGDIRLRHLWLTIYSV